MVVVVVVVVAVVAVVPVCPCGVPHLPYYVWKNMWKSRLASQISLYRPGMGRRCERSDIGLRMGRPCPKWKDSERQWAKMKEDGAILFCLFCYDVYSTRLCLYIYIAFITAAASCFYSCC